MELKLIDAKKFWADLIDTGYFTQGDMDVIESVLNAQRVLANTETGRPLIEIADPSEPDDSPIATVGDDRENDRLVLDDENRLSYYNVKTLASSPENVEIVPGLLEPGGLATCICERCYVLRFADPV